MALFSQGDSFSLNNKQIFLAIFLLTCAIIALVQLVLFPYIFPTWHAGDGLLIGGDSVAFHTAAVAMAERIEQEGWSTWQLRPQGWTPAGITAAIYALTWPKPWVLIPLNAAVHAATFLLIMKIFLLIFPHRRNAFIAALPFAFFPSAMLWYTQIHSDGYQILGTMLILYGFLLIADRKNSDWQQNAGGFLSASAGVFTIWFVRPHSLVILQYMLIILVIFVALVLLTLAVTQKIAISKVLVKVIILSLVVILIVPLTRTAGAAKYQAETIDFTENNHYPAGQEKEQIKYDWEKLAWLPQAVDNQLYSVAYLRAVTYQTKYGETASGIDYDVTFHNGYDFIVYLPRALQIAFLSPFPADWFGEGKYASTTFFRRVAAFEMVFIYLSLLCLFYGIYLWRKKIEMWVILLFCTVMMLPFVYSVPNMGTLYRYRYGYLMVLVGLGVASALELVACQKKRAALTADRRE